METDPKSPTPTPQSPPPIQPENKASTVAPPTPWEGFLIGKKASADRFLAKMGTGAITIPDNATRNQFAEVIAAKPERISRLIELLQASAASSDTIRRIVDGFAAVSLMRLGVVPFPEPLDVDAFRDVVLSWLTCIPKKPLKPAQMNVLFLLLHFGQHRQLLDHDTAISLVASAVLRSARPRPKKAQTTTVAKRAKPSSKRVQIAKPDPMPLEVILTSARSAAAISSLLALHRAMKKETDKLNAQIQTQSGDIASLKAESVGLHDTIANIRGEIAAVQKEKAAAEASISNLEKQLVDVRDGYQHKLDELRGRIRGVLQGQLTRWLETALDASRSDPPWAQAIQERLEDALKLIEKETQWLQPSV